MADKIHSIAQTLRAQNALADFQLSCERLGAESVVSARLLNKWDKIINEPGEWEALGPISEWHKANFETMRRAFGEGVVAIMTARRITGPLVGTQVTLLCCMADAPGGEIDIMPIAELIDGNPYLMYRTEIEGASPYEAAYAELADKAE